MTIHRQGICLNCAHATDCALKPAKCAASGTLFCEEYEMAPLAVVGPSRKKPPQRAAARGRARILGLCGNCANYPDCAYPKPEAGVWHCEDYL